MSSSCWLAIDFDQRCESRILAASVSTERPGSSTNCEQRPKYQLSKGSYILDSLQKLRRVVPTLGAMTLGYSANIVAASPIHYLSPIPTVIGDIQGCVGGSASPKYRYASRSAIFSAETIASHTSRQRLSAVPSTLKPGQMKLESPPSACQCADRNILFNA
jgi:hypothetical protein